MNTPSSLYQKQIDKGEVTHDQGQVDALAVLDQLHHDLLEKQNSHSQRSWWKKLLGEPKPSPCKGVYLYGGVGTGKTFLMDLFFQSLPPRMAKRIHFHRFMQSVHERRAEIKDQQRPLDIIAGDISQKHQVLCLDEFAVTDITDAMILYGLLDSLFSRGVSLVTTSNIEQMNLYKDGLQRARFLPAIDLLKSHTTEVNVDSGNDYRMAFLQSESLYHSPLTHTTNEKLQSSFAHLGGYVEESKSCIVLSGREVEVVATGSGIVWFEFAVLCQSHRSKMDYIEIAKRFHTLILANIPALTEDDNDATRRLIELIDELYDRGVNLIISAESQPEELYLGKRLAMPFERTISRLQEMTSEAYLARPHIP
ncbi:MAG: AFG1 family ATPase [Acidiferrobacterales bacterium]|nr:AFG1 family ATPase [Acidiferrobacterales bacterium]